MGVRLIECPLQEVLLLYSKTSPNSKNILRDVRKKLTRYMKEFPEQKVETNQRTPVTEKKYMIKSLVKL